MGRTEAIEVLLNLKLFVKMNREEDEAFDMAIAALEGKDINVPSKEESIPIDWIEAQIPDSTDFYAVVTAIILRHLIDEYRKEQNNEQTE